MKALIVDDNAADRKILRYILERHGCAVMEAIDGEEGLALARNRPDLIISDALMPKLDGFHFLRELKRDPLLRTIPFIFYSSVYTGDRDEKLALSLGASAFVVKPMEPERLWESIDDIMAGRTAWQETVVAELLEEEEKYLREYSHLVATKIEEKVRELEQAYHEIHQSAKLYRNLFSSIRDTIIVTDDNRTIIDANQPALRETFGYELAEVKGRNVRFLYATESDYLAAGREVRLLEEAGKPSMLEVECQKKSGDTFSGELVIIRRWSEEGVPEGIVGIIRDISERKRAEEALSESEQRRYQLQAQLACAAEIQTKLLPRFSPLLAGFEIAAHCLPAHQVGGDFYDWQEVMPGIVTLTIGDVMGNGMAAALVMTEVRATVRALTRQYQPAAALNAAERVLRDDLENSESFVTLFHARLDTASRSLSYVDCGHGFAFLKRCNGTVEELQPRGVPLGVPSQESYQEGKFTFAGGDALVLFSDGLIDARPELALTPGILARHLDGAASAQEMVDRLLAVPALDGPPPDDLTLLVVRARKMG
jgi:sigma-B regulation protein RsbU (phosphoserine phosphatase)